MNCLPFLAISIFVGMMNSSMIAILKGMNMFKFASFNSLFWYYVFFMPMTYILGVKLEYGLAMIYFLLAVTMIGLCIMNGLRLFIFTNWDKTARELH